MIDEVVECEAMLLLQKVELFILKDRKRGLLASGPLAMLLSEIDGNDHMLLVVDNNFRYALNKKLPAMRVADRSYVLPSEKQFFGIVLHPDTPTDEIDVFEAFLREFAVFRISKYSDQSSSIEQMEDFEIKDADIPTEKDLTAAPSDTSSDNRIAETGQSVAKYIAIGGSHIASGIKTVGVYGGKGIIRGGKYIKSKLSKKDEPSTVSEKTKSRIHHAKTVSGSIVVVSKALVVGAVATAGALSSGFVSVAGETKYGKKIKESSGPRSEAAKQIVKNSVIAAVEVVIALEEAGLQLVKDTGDATADILDHRYGKEVGDASKEAMSIAYDVGSARIALRKVGVKSLVKRTAAEATLELTSSEKENESRKAAKPQINPMIGAGAMMMSSQLAQQYDASGGILNSYNQQNNSSVANKQNFREPTVP